MSLAPMASLLCALEKEGYGREPVLELPGEAVDGLRSIPATVTFGGGVEDDRRSKTLALVRSSDSNDLCRGEEVRLRELDGRSDGNVLVRSRDSFDVWGGEEFRRCEREEWEVLDLECLSPEDLLSSLSRSRSFFRRLTSVLGGMMGEHEAGW